MNKTLCTVASLFLLIGLSSAAHAGMIRSSGAVTGFQTLAGAPSSAPVDGFSIGDPFVGTLTIDDAILAPGAIFGNAAIRRAAFRVGATPIVNAQTSFAGTIAENERTLSVFSAFTGISNFGPECVTCLSEIRTRTFSIQSFVPGSGQILGRFDTAVNRAVATVPAPGGLGSLGLILIGVALWARSRGRDGIAGSSRAPI